MPASTGQRHSRKRRRWLEFAALILLTSTAVFLWTAPLRHEQALRKASLTELEAASKQNPHSPRVDYYLGLRLRGAGRVKDAEAAFMHAAELDVDDEDIWLAWSGTAAARKETQKTFDILSLFVAKHPRSARAHLALARWYQDNRAYKRAYEEARTASGLNPADPESWRLAGIGAMTWNRGPEAEQNLRRAVALAPKDWRNQIGLGDALAQKNNGPAAEACFREAVRLAPQQAVTHLSLGRFLLQHATTATEIDAARAALMKSTTLGPMIPLAHMLLGQAYDMKGDWQKARQALEIAQELDARNAKVAYRLSRVYEHLGKHAAANRELERYRRLYAYDSERRRLQESILQKRDDIYMRLKLARLCAAHGDSEEAARQYSQILGIAPGMEIARRELESLERSAPRQLDHGGTSAEP